jgi:photosystem II stability/assembly factor-like uncharacterized protein
LAGLVVLGHAVPAFADASTRGPSWQDVEVPPLLGSDDYESSSDLIVAGGGSLYVAASGSTLAVSRDGGSSWSYPLPHDAAIRAMAVSPHDPDVVYVAYDPDPDSSDVRTVIARTGDGGEDWSESPRHHGSRSRLAVDPADARTLIEADDDGELYLSRDGGLSDAEVDDAGAPSDDEEVPPAIAWSGRTLYALYSQGSGLLRASDDAGRSWTSLPQQDLPSEPGDLTADPAHPSVLFMRAQSNQELYVSADGGNRWASVYKPPLGGEMSPPAFGDDGSVFATAGALTIVSHDGGASWAPLLAREARAVNAVAWCKGDLFATGDSALYRLPGAAGFAVPDNAVPTFRVVDEGLEVGFGQDGDRYLTLPGFSGKILHEPGNPRLAYALSSSPDMDDEEEVPYDEDYDDEAEDENADSEDTVRDSASGCDDGGHHLYATDDAGVNWRLAAVGLGRVRVDPTDPTHLYAIDCAHGIGASEDGGKSWKTIGETSLQPDTDADGVGDDQSYVLSRLAAPASRWSTLYALYVAPGPHSILERSDDAGATWRLVDTGGPLGQVTRLEVDPSRPDRVKVVSTSTQIVTRTFKTRDGGKNWTVKQKVEDAPPPAPPEPPEPSDDDFDLDENEDGP